MASKKPWRTLVSVGDTAGRFTREQVEAAVLAVKAESERKAAAKAARARKGSEDNSSRKRNASKSAAVPAQSARKTPKAA